MQNETRNPATGASVTEPARRDPLFPGSILIAALIVVGALVYTAGSRAPRIPPGTDAVPEGERTQMSALEEAVLPAAGVTLPVRWGDLGVKMTSVGVIDKEKFFSLYAGRGGSGAEERRMLEDVENGQIRMTRENAGFLLNLFWALGLGTKNAILEQGPMSDPQYGGPGRFASTGGWTLAVGDAMGHYSRHPFIVLAPEQQVIVERVAKGIFRPCCDNATYFPDCNHGMAMLGLLELMASQGVSEDEMYRIALRVNAYWFPDTYLAIAEYLESKGTSWSKADPEEILGYDYSSASGYRRILSEITPQERRGGGSCGI